ncbi:MAG TPA: hypothetical protein VFI73_03840 [Candidatus Nitrosopolaris sp.]|nr:hypothetical protein [Candidatus Nitrosopolaris sp.]
MPPLQEQTDSKLPRNELTFIKKFLQQINGILEQNARIEHQLKGISRDIKLISQTQDEKLVESEGLFKQIRTQIEQLQTHVTQIGNAVDNAFTNIKSEKRGKKKNKKGKKNKK